MAIVITRNKLHDVTSATNLEIHSFVAGHSGVISKINKLTKAVNVLFLFRKLYGIEHCTVGQCYDQSTLIVKFDFFNSGAGVALVAFFSIGTIFTGLTVDAIFSVFTVSTDKRFKPFFKRALKSGLNSKIIN